ncbi:MAG TPA: pyridoxal 5'-phosphate synthase glutaminase subunit PdxT [Verrucomicrobiae bacterium]|nr:pyridoxal 5'-phosphate synthase glutaminase subunit PdxT [Verrucomicrobiae bacterium]
MTPKIGVLALQGDFAAHVAALDREGIGSVEVRYAAQLDLLDGLIVPGGESTTLLRLIADLGLWAPLRAFHARGGAVFGTCAGAILIAREVFAPKQPSLDFLDIDVERNAYGRQRESFEVDGPAPAFGEVPLPMVFIRAPRIVRVGAGVEVLASHRGEPVLVRRGAVMAGTFHPEMTADGRVHRHFASIAASRGAAAS